MAGLTELIATAEETLRAEDAKTLWSDNLCLQEDNKKAEIPIDLEIQATLEQLKNLKFQNIGLRTKELFLQRVLDSNSVQETFPTPQDVAKIELSLGREKTKLRGIKAARAAAEKSLEEIAAEADRVSRGRAVARVELERALKHMKSASRLEVVKTALVSENDGDLENLIRDVDDLDSISCQHITQVLQKKKRVLEKEANIHSHRSETLRMEAEGLEKEVSQMQRESDSLQAQISKGDKENKHAEALRQEWTLQEELGGLLSALIGIRISADRQNGITIEINDSVFANPGTSGAKSQSSPTHTLEVEFGTNDLGEAIVAYMHLTPSDIDVSDIVEDLNLSLERGVQKLFSRFMRLQEQKATIAGGQ